MRLAAGNSRRRSRANLAENAQVPQQAYGGAHSGWQPAPPIPAPGRKFPEEAPQGLVKKTILDYIILTQFKRAVNSAVECHPHTVEVTGSNPVPPTI